MLSDEEKQHLQQELQKLKERETNWEKRHTATGKKRKAALSYTHLGLEFAIAILLFLFLGHYLDRLWHTSPWLLLAGVLLGFASGLLRLLRVAEKMDRNE